MGGGRVGGHPRDSKASSSSSRRTSQNHFTHAPRNVALQPRFSLYIYLRGRGRNVGEESERGRERVVGVKRGWWRSNNGNENWVGVLVRGRSYG